MNPTSKETSAPQASTAPPEQLAVNAIGPQPGETAFNGQPEQQGPANQEKATVPAPTGPPTTTIPLPTPPVMTGTAAQTDVPATTPNPVLLADDDSDLIEQEWVNKAKQIVERNKDDPYKQSEELTVFKADYMKKRYGKTIKISQ